MHNRSSLMQKTLAYWLSAWMVVQPVSAQVVVDATAPASQQANVTSTDKGVPLINIAAPNANGLSHNQFESYSVTDSNLILNNSDTAVETLISGEIGANPNLTDGTASLILNEVTGGGRSLLEGYTEIAGDEAELIIANPNGITCNGCGFINTPRAVLSTGTPQISNGRLMALSVDQGDILIDGDGLNAGNIDQFDLITRSAQIDAKLLGLDLNIITGRNDVDYATLGVTPKAPVGANKPSLAIDSSLLGGMYANTIHLVATENGVGVNLAGDMATNTGAVTLAADGSISLNSVNAEQGLQVQSHAGDVTVGSLAYGQTVDIDAHGTLNNGGIVASSSHLKIDAQTVTNSGRLIAGLNRDGSLTTGSGLSLNTEQLTNSGQILATEDVTLSSSSIANQKGTIEALNGDLTLDQVTSLDNSDGKLIAGNDIALTIDSFTPVKSHGFDAGRNLVINTAKFSNSDEFKLDFGLVLNLTEDFSNSGLIETSGDLSVNARSFSNQGSGTVTSDGLGEIVTTADMVNLGVLTAATGLTVDADNIRNVGVIASGDAMTLKAQGAIVNSNADSDGLPIAASGLLNGGGDLATGGGGANGTLLFSVGEMNLYSDSLLNRYADIYSFGDLTIAADDQGAANSSVINSSSRIESASNLTITTRLFENKRDPIGDYDYSELCADSDDYLCTHNILGGDDLGIPSDTPLSKAWLFDVAFDLLTGNN